MIDVHELLRTKENDLIRIRKEVEALRMVAPLLSDSEVSMQQTDFDSAEARLAAEIDAAQGSPSPAEQLDEASSESTLPKRSLRTWLSRAAGE